MYFSLSVKNIRKSFKDYTIYFLTLVLGVSIFYMFNSLGAQQAMLGISGSKADIVQLLVNMIAGISVAVAIILGFLIVYANGFLIKRRKREFGIYMSLGMGKSQVIGMLISETILIGLISLVTGIVVGVFGSQLMSIVVASMFEADMSKYKFIFSISTVLKTCICFGIMYMVVFAMNSITITRYKLLDLLTAVKRGENVKLKNPIVQSIVFLISILLIGFAYYNMLSLDPMSGDPLSGSFMFKQIAYGALGTLLLFWSLSGFVILLVQKNKRVYFRDLNIFTLRQISSRINTTVIAMTVVCLMVFTTISALSVSIGMSNSLRDNLDKNSPVDLNLIIDESNGTGTLGNRASIKEMLEKKEFDFSKLKDVEDVFYYQTDLGRDVLFGDIFEEMAKNGNFFSQEKETCMKVSDYNKIARQYGNEEYTLKKDEYIVICDFYRLKELRDKVMSEKPEIEVLGHKYKSKYDTTKDGFVMMRGSALNIGIVLLPDDVKLSDDMRFAEIFAANYSKEGKEGKQSTEKYINKFIESKKMGVSKESKIDIYSSSTGLGSMAIFISIYIGLVFLISSATILSLKELSESIDSKQKYTVLRKIGADEKLINKSVFAQTAIFFSLPMFVAFIHSIVGINFGLKVVSAFVEVKELMIPVICTAGFIVLIYGLYFVATYQCEKSIIKD
ncbi:MAG: ABC transporter permease [Clostridioides sp.]|jgi:putative ABC transport system permease protein|nr:ABC transporter permease [Clostridioides sp.]